MRNKVALEHDQHLQFIPVIVLTSTATPREVNRCYELGANAYLVKPVGIKEYFALLKTTIEFWSACKFRTLAE